METDASYRQWAMSQEISRVWLSVPARNLLGTIKKRLEPVATQLCKCVFYPRVQWSEGIGCMRALRMPAIVRFQTNHGDDNHLVVQAVRLRAFPNDWPFVMLSFILVLVCFCGGMGGRIRTIASK